MDMDMEKRKYKVLEPYLNRLTKTEISLDEDEQKRYNTYLDEVLNKKLVPAMKQNDPLFMCMFKRFLFAGSSYENLKVGKPNEFDINLQFNLPVSDIEITDNHQPGFVEVWVKSFDEKETRRCFQNFPDGEAKLRKMWLDDKGYLLRNKVTNWMQGVVDKAVKALKTQDLISKLQLSCSRSGPAITLKIKQENNENEQEELVEFSVDLVPVFVFSKNEWPRSMRRSSDDSSSESQEWCIVPKPPYNRTEVTFWRASFYAQEKSIMNNKNSMKKALKLIKLLRDKQKWINLSSYYIKTVFLWETTERDASFWSQGSVSFIFMHMLKKLMSFLQKKEIPFFWDERVNLLAARHQDELNIMYNRIVRILKKIDEKLEGSPYFILTFFGWSEDQINLEFTPTSPGNSIDRTSTVWSSPQRVTSSPRNSQDTISPERSSPQQMMSGLDRPKQPSEDGPGSAGSSRSRSKDSAKPSQPLEDDDDEQIDWNTVQAVIKIGAFAGAIFAAGAYLMLRNAQRQARRQQAGSTTNTTSMTNDDKN